VRLGAVSFILLLASAALLADDHTVLFDRQVDYSRFRTFTIRDGDLKSRRPEFDNPIVIKNLAGAIRAGLAAKGLKEAGDAADLHVEFHVKTADYDTNKWGVTREVNDRSAGRGRRGPGRSDIVQADFTDATLIVDFMAGKPRELVWRGVYNDTERDTMKLVDALPRNAATLLAKYPPQKK
jgi:hypothetical protein